MEALCAEHMVKNILDDLMNKRKLKLAKTNSKSYILTLYQNERSTEMKRAVQLFAIFVLLICGTVFSQYGSSASYNLQWKVIDAGGKEGDVISSTNYRLSSAIGQGTPVLSGPSTSTSYSMYPGFRKIDLDMRYPFSWFTYSVRHASGLSFQLRWAGIDTTREDGWGWGIWNYDVQYKVGIGGAWTDWRMATTDTMATFGPSSPVVVVPGQSYYFRLRARDKARNVAPWGSDTITTVNYVVEFCVYTVPPGLPTTSANYVVLSYYDAVGHLVTTNIWQGSCAQVWCVPGTQARVTSLSSASSATQRWVVNTPTDDTIWTIDGSLTDIDVGYWHQLKPIVYLMGTDPAHTVSTIRHNQFGPGHLESLLHTVWNEWTDYGSLLEFTDTTTGVPRLRASPLDSVRFHNITSYFNDTIRYMAASINITVRTNFGGDSVRVDGVWYPSPYNTIWFDMSVHELSAKDTIRISPCERYVFENWSDGGARTHLVTALRDSTFTANYRHEYKFDIANPSGWGTPVPSVGSYWRTAGDTVVGSISPTFVPPNRYLVGYTGTGSAISGGGSNFWFILNDCSSISWVWTTSDEPLCTIWVYSPYGHPHPVGAYVVPRMTLVTCSVEDSTFEGGIWHHCTGWRGDGTVVPASGTDNIATFTVTGNGWLVWLWDGSCLLPLTISSTPGIYGSPTPPVGTHWIACGAFVNAFVNNPDGDWWCMGFIGSGSVSSSSADSVYFALTSPTSINWQWQYYPTGELETLWVFSPYGSPVPAVGRHIYPRGTLITAYVPSPSGGHTCTGWRGTGSVPPTGSTNSVTFTITDFSTLTWQWDGITLVPFTVFNPTGLGSPVPPVGTHWNSPGTVVDAFVHSPDAGWYCVGYRGFGDLPAFGYTDSVRFTHNTATIVEWLWSNDVVSLDVTAPVYSGAVPPIGRTWHPRGRFINASAIDVIYDTPESRHVCLGWTGTGSVPPSGTMNTFSFTINANSTITWQYKDQFLLQLTYTGSPAPPSRLVLPGWYDSGDTAKLVTDSIIWVGSTPYVFDFWDDRSAGAIIGDTRNDSTYVVMHAPYSIIARFGLGVLVNIVKDPAHDTPGWIAVDGDTFYTGHYHSYWVAGSSHNIAVSAVDSLDTMKYVFNRWRDNPTAGRARTVVALGDTTFTAEYLKQFRIIVVKRPSANTLGSLTVDGFPYYGPASIRQVLWWTQGSTHNLIASTPDSSAFVKYYFVRWSTGATTPSINYGPVTRSDSLTAIYNQYYLCTIKKEPLEAHGSIYVAGVRYPRVATKDFWAQSGITTSIGVSAVDTVADSAYIFRHWAMDLSTDTVRASPVITRPDTFVAIYEGIKVIISFRLGQYGIYPNDSVYWNIEDSLHFNYEKTMLTRDSIKVYNLSNVAIDLGLQISAILDTSRRWAPDPYWTPGYSPANNRFVLRGRFDDNEIPPTTWNAFRDYIDYVLRFATRGTFAIFGPGGSNIPPPPGANTEKLWMQIITPTESTNPQSTRCIKVKIYARLYMP